MPLRPFVLRPALLGLLLSSTSACAQSPPAAPPPPPLSADSVRRAAAVLLSPAATQGDLALLARAYSTFHPGLTRYQSKADFDARVAALHTYFAEPRTRAETYLALAGLSASIGCSHTYLNFWNQPRATKRWLTDGRDKLPFTFRLSADDHWVVTRSAVFAAADSTRLQLAPGDTVVALNGVATSELVARLLPLVRGDGDSDGKRRSLLESRPDAKYLTTDVLLPLLLPPESGRYRLAVRRGGATDTLDVDAIDAITRRTVARPLPAAREPWSLVVEGSVATMTVDGFSDGDEWRTFVRRSFAQLRRDRVTGLIVDLRGNEGGADAAAALLLTHLLQQPLMMPPVRRFVVYQTVPADLRPLLNTWDDGFYDRRSTSTPRGDGTFDLGANSDWPAKLTPARDAFRGRVVVLTSLVNSSASHMVVRLLARQPHVTLVGEPTGGSLRASTGGNLFFLQLQATGFEADVPLIAYEWGAAQPAGGVQPDIVTPVDEALVRARALFESNR